MRSLPFGSDSHFAYHQRLYMIETYDFLNARFFCVIGERRLLGEYHHVHPTVRIIARHLPVVHL